MARTVRNAKLDTRSGRLKGCLPRREPYWTNIAPGCALGYRRGATGGTWIARRYDRAAETVRIYHSIGAADDVMDADGVAALSYGQAQERARAWFSEAAVAARTGEAVTGAYTVGDALDAYVAKLAAEGKASETDARQRVEGIIRPSLGKIQVRDLTAARLRKFLDEIATAPRRVRGKKGKPARVLETAPTTDDEKRARRSNANRTWTTLRAALNLAFAEGKTSTDAAWRKVKGFKGADSARTGYLQVAEAQRLLNASPPPFRALATAALLTGARYGELGRLNAGDYDHAGGTVLVRQSKAGRARRVYLTGEGKAFFARQTAGKASDAPMLPKADGSRWGVSHQKRPMAEACKAAKVSPVGFHQLRHTYASLSIMGGAPLPVVAANLGHTSTRMVEKHYGHLAETYLAETVARTAPTFGLAADATVAQLKSNPQAA